MSAATRHKVGSELLEFISEFTVRVFGVGNQLLVLGIHDPIQVFQRNLADNVGQRIGNRYNVKPPNAPLSLQGHRRVRRPGF